MSTNAKTNKKNCFLPTGWKPFSKIATTHYLHTRKKENREFSSAVISNVLAVKKISLPSLIEILSS
jgi:hypothetical protein